MTTDRKASRLVQRVRQRLYQDLNPERMFARDFIARCEKASRILDIGCGREAPLLKNASGIRVGVDLVPDFVPSPGVRLIRGDCHALPFADGSFDLIACTSVLEHITDPLVLFKEVRRVLAPGGQFVVLTPNRWDYVSVASSVIPNSLHPSLVHTLTGRAAADTFPTHYRANTAGTLKRLADDADLLVKSIGLFRQHPHYLYYSTPLYFVGVVIEQLLQRPFASLRPWIMATFSRAGCVPPISTAYPSASRE